MLFPELRAASDRTPLGDVFYDDWIKVQDVAVLNAAEERKVFHSFRKTGGADLKDAGVVSELRADILGHGGANTTEERYVSSAKLRQMLDALQKLPVVTAHIDPRKVCLRRDILQKRSRPSARPRRQTRWYGNHNLGEVSIIPPSTLRRARGAQSDICREMAKLGQFYFLIVL